MERLPYRKARHHFWIAEVSRFARDSLNLIQGTWGESAKKQPPQNNIAHLAATSATDPGNMRTITIFSNALLTYRELNRVRSDWHFYAEGAVIHIALDDWN